MAVLRRLGCCKWPVEASVPGQGQASRFLFLEMTLDLPKKLHREGSAFLGLGRNCPLAFCSGKFTHQVAFFQTFTYTHIHTKGFFFLLLRLHPQHMEVPRLGIESELQLPAYITAMATSDLRCICNLHPSSQQHHDP